MKKLMLIYYNIVAVLTILYLVLTAYLMNFGNSFITSQGWHVMILGTLILVIIFGMEDSLFDELRKSIYNKPRMARCNSWHTHPSDYIWDGSCEEEVSR